jgi:hypothetical protein
MEILRVVLYHHTPCSVNYDVAGFCQLSISYLLTPSLKRGQQFSLAHLVLHTITKFTPENLLSFCQNHYLDKHYIEKPFVTFLTTALELKVDQNKRGG